jgi:hypothetical protein
MRQRYRFDGVLTPESGPYVYLPFDVPPGARRIEVSYQFEDRTLGDPDSRANVIDIGVFDPRGHEFLGAGFRGWSGSARRQFFLAPDSATPGYLPGPLIPGTWNIVLGRAELHDPACRYWVDVNVDVDIAATNEPAEAFTPPRTIQRLSPRLSPPRWWKGDLHTHTVHSDGSNTVAELADQARERGLHFFAVTDHNTCSHIPDVLAASSPDLLIIPGEEVTTYKGHANVWGMPGWVDFRCDDIDAIARLMAFVHEAGGLFSPNHPKQYGPPWLFTDLRGYGFMEVWQAPWRWHNEESREFWLRHLDEGRRITALGGSDTHAIPPAARNQPNGLGEPCTWVRSPGPLDEGTVLDALLAGHVFISESFQGPFLELSADLGDGRFGTLMGDVIESLPDSRLRCRVRYRGPVDKRIVLYRNRDVYWEARAPVEDYVEEISVPVEGRTYIRLEAIGFRGRPERGEVVHAMTNPLYVGEWKREGPGVQA